MAPYDGTAGWTSTDTSEERAHREVADGSLSKRRRDVMDLMERSAGMGMTWIDVADTLDLHHGSASSVLSNLHAEGLIARTKRRRHGSRVYLKAEHALPSDTLEPYVHRGKQHEDEVTALHAEIEVLQDRIAEARVAILDGSGTTAVLRILERS